MTAGVSRLVIGVLVTLHGLAAGNPAGTNEANAERSFRLRTFAYSSNYTVVLLPASHPAAIKSFFYGGPETNLVFATEQTFSKPLTDGPAIEAGERGPAGNAPARPARPLFRVDRWNREEGLPANKVSALLQSRDGFLWIGTVGGVARFDGVRFEVFNESNAPEMRTNGTVGRALFEDVDGRLWIGTERGMLCRARGAFVAFPGQDEVRGCDIRCFARRTGGGFWFGADDRLAYWDGAGVHWHEPRASSSASRGRVMALAEDADGVLWMGTVSNLWRVTQATGGVSPVLLGGAPRTAVQGLFLDRAQTLWIGSGRGVWRRPRGRLDPIPIGPPDPESRIIPHASQFAEDADGAIWATTAFGDGIMQLRPSADGVEKTLQVPELHETLCALVDREGVLWVGARDQGLIRLRAQPIATVSFGSRGNLDHVRSIAQDPDGSLWFASRAGFGNWTRRDLALVATGALGPCRMSPIFVLPSGSVWTVFGTSGVFEPLAVRERARLLMPAAPFLPELGEVQVIYARRDASLWLGTTNGLYRLRGSGSESSWTAAAPNSTPPTAQRIEGLPDPDVRALFEDRRGEFWVGTSGGLCRLLPHQDRVELCAAGLQGQRVGAFHESEDGALWIGGEIGLYRMRSGELSSFPAESGVPQQAVHCILEDASQRLWISHAAGLIRVKRSELEDWLRDSSGTPAVAEFGAEDEVLNPEMSGGSQPAGLKSRDGRLWFPNRGGLVVVDPARCPETPAPRVFVQEILVDGKSRPAAGQLELPPGAGANLEIRYTATSLASPSRVRFRFRLEGQDRDWREAGTLRWVSYAGLRPGRYQFRVRARNHEGRWSEHDAVLAIYLAPHLWQTWSFRGICALALGAGAAGLGARHLRGQRRRLEAERQRSLESERRRIARDMHDHLGAQLAGLALASGQDTAAHQRVRDSLRELNDLIWAVHPDNDTLASLADFIANFASRYLGLAGVALELDLPERIPPAPIASRLRHELAAAFKEALRNIVQHARARLVTIRLRCGDGQLTLSVADDGVGFEAAAEEALEPGEQHGARVPGQGNGLRNYQIRCASLGGSCRLRSSPGQGTTVEFVVPLDF